jgi:hypothetical protein
MDHLLPVVLVQTADCAVGENVNGELGAGP